MLGWRRTHSELLGGCMDIPIKRDSWFGDETLADHDGSPLPEAAEPPSEAREASAPSEKSRYLPDTREPSWVDGFDE